MCEPEEKNTVSPVRVVSEEESLNRKRFISTDNLVILTFNDDNEKQYWVCKDDILADSGTRGKLIKFVL